MNSEADNNGICVVHLIRKCNGLEPFNKYISSYRKYNAGMSHTLLLLFKGFSCDSDITEYEELIKDLEYEKIFVEDTGFDIGSYMYAFNKNKNNYEYFCFINSYSEILCSNWLEIMYRHIIKPGVGLTGVTGSYQSISSDCLYDNFAYGRVFRFHPIRKPIFKFRLYIRRLKNMRLFPEYPNAHIRTNGFMVPSEVLDKIKISSLRNKLDVYQFESGNQSLTRQIQDMGLKPVVVDCSGIAYQVEDWYKSNTFWRASQGSLLISDNQTRVYDDANQRLKVIYSHHAWGENCHPDISTLQ